MGAAEPLTIIRERYRLDALIGEGGMAGVWRAWDLTLQRPVAVKLLFARDARDEDVLVARFLREARIAASVQHRNVIHIVDFGTTPENQPFMVMELLEGETLQARLRRDKRLSVSDAVQIASLTLRGLSAVHAAGIIHRDLKPDNVYLKSEGGMVYPKILDFGISRSIDSGNSPRSALTTRDGVIVGTPEYMSPEQARGVKSLDYRTDLYSMGVMLYEALTGQLPYSSENVGDLIIKIVGGGAPRVHELLPEVPLPISEVIAQAMSRQAGERYPDAIAMQEALLAAATRSLGARAARALSDLPPQGLEVPLPLVPLYLRTTRPPRSPAPRMPSPIPVLRALAVTARPRRSPRSDPRPDPAPESTDALAGLAIDPLEAGQTEAALESSRIPISGDHVSATAELSEYVGKHEFDAVAPLNPRPRWLAPVAAAGGVVLLGLGMLWLAPAPAPEPTPRPVLPPSAAVGPTPIPAKVRLTLRGLPDNAAVTIDGEASGPELELPRDPRPRNLSVSAPGKLPWHIAYVANADQSLDVVLQDAPAPAAAAPKAKRSLLPRKKSTKAPGALRVPDF